MSEDTVDILQQINDIDLSTVETSFPLLKSGIVKAQITKCQWGSAQSKKDVGKTNHFVEVEYALTIPWQTSGHDGDVKTINPGDRGSRIRETIYVGKYFDEKEGKEKWYGVEQLTKLREAVFGKAPEGTKFNADELLGQDITLRLLFEKAPVNKDTKEVMGPRTRVQDYVRKATK